MARAKQWSRHGSPRQYELTSDSDRECSMAHTKSAIKKVRQYKENQVRNSAARSLVKTSNKKLLAALAAKEPGAIETAYRALCSALDKAAKKGSLKKETAVRRKARVGRTVRLALQPQPAA
jgi:small subunit ribosomal protein S20